MDIINSCERMEGKQIHQCIFDCVECVMCMSAMCVLHVHVRSVCASVCECRVCFM